MEPKDLLFPLIGALWAFGNLILTVTFEANRIRDRVIIGCDGEHDLDPEFRKHLMSNDWIPYSIFVTVACLSFGVLAVWSPHLLSDSAQRATAQPIALFVGFASVFMGACWILTAYRDWIAMKRAIARATK